MFVSHKNSSPSSTECSIDIVSALVTIQQTRHFAETFLAATNFPSSKISITLIAKTPKNFDFKQRKPHYASKLNWFIKAKNSLRVYCSLKYSLVNCAKTHFLCILI